jgi:hypothetical protein
MKLYLTMILSIWSSYAGAFQIEEVTYAGTGCPENSAFVNVSDDGQAMTVGFDQFYSELSERVFDRQACDIKLKLRVPAGKSYGLFCVDFRGFASIDDEVGAELGSSYRFGSQPYAKLASLKLPNNYNDDFSLLTAINDEKIQWSPCGESIELDLKTVTLLYANHFGRGVPRGWQPLSPATGGLLAVDSLDGAFKMHFGIKTRNCR